VTAKQLKPALAALWGADVHILRLMAEEMDRITGRFNLEKTTCTCGESERYLDMKQRVLSERARGIAERLRNLADDVERRAPEFIQPRSE